MELCKCQMREEDVRFLGWNPNSDKEDSVDTMHIPPPRLEYICLGYDGYLAPDPYFMLSEMTEAKKRT